MTQPIGLQTTLPPKSSADATTVAPATGDAEYRAKATAAAEKFEGFFIGQMLKQMRAATSEFAAEGSVFKDPVNSDMLGMADTMLADKMAGQHAFGIADAILRQLLPVTTSPPTVLNAQAAPVASPERPARLRDAGPGAPDAGRPSTEPTAPP